MLDLVIESQTKTIKKKIIIRKNTNDIENKLTEQFTSSLNLNNDYNNFKSTENLNTDSNLNPVIIKVKKSTKKPISKNNKIINNNINSSNDLLSSSELSYDLNIKNEFLINLSLHNNTVNYNLINKLPQLRIKNTNLVNEDIDECDEENNEININNENDDIDKDSLEMDKIGDKNYYFDYDKGIIYNLKYIEVGHIDEYGEINLNDE